MNRYLLTISLICLSSNSTILNSSIEKKLYNEADEWRKIKKEMKKKIPTRKNNNPFNKSKAVKYYEKRFDIIVKRADLTLKQLDKVFFLKRKCSDLFIEYIDERFQPISDKLPTLNQTSLKYSADKHMEYLLVHIIHAKADYLFEKLDLDIETQKKLRQEIYREALQIAREEIPGSLSYLVDGTFKEKIRKKVENLRKKTMEE